MSGGSSGEGPRTWSFNEMCIGKATDGVHGCYILPSYSLGESIWEGQGKCKAVSGVERSGSLGRTDTRAVQIRKSWREVDRGKYIHLTPSAYYLFCWE